MTSTPATEGAIDGELPSIVVSGSGEPGDPYDLTLNDAWAARVADLPRGVVAYAQVTGPDQTGIVGSVVDVSGLSVTFDAAPDRRYRVSAPGLVTSSAPNDVYTLYITTGSGTVVGDAHGILAIAGGGVSVFASRIETGLSGTTTRKVRVQRVLGSGSLTFYSASTRPAYIMVEDVGAV